LKKAALLRRGTRSLAGFFKAFSSKTGFEKAPGGKKITTVRGIVFLDPGKGKPLVFRVLNFQNV
jgi:hypothetical protein